LVLAGGVPVAVAVGPVRDRSTFFLLAQQAVGSHDLEIEKYKETAKARL
jgi:hypothetical protein